MFHNSIKLYYTAITNHNNKYTWQTMDHAYISYNFSSSSDSTVRLWTLAGGYLGTLGTILPWEPLLPHIPPPVRKKMRLPPDIRKVASSTTIKVI